MRKGVHGVMAASGRVKTGLEHRSLVFLIIHIPAVFWQGVRLLLSCCLHQEPSINKEQRMSLITHVGMSDMVEGFSSFGGELERTKPDVSKREFFYLSVLVVKGR